jgi:2-polyprenyl-3-methyl-5-hydroxy-6-metoxy-1,4-benzoquinol methylase|tara:strand:+ start:341 stop:928 length:588 start_codon:yes stop_codon:yes gene_type:complete
MELSKIDRRMFEYLSHLKFGKVDHKELSWNDHLKLPDSDWQFPSDLETYFKEVFYKNADVIQGKRILDVGCEYGNKIPWIDKFAPQELTCIDPNKDDLYIAEYVGGLATSPVTCVEAKAEDHQLDADTIFMLSVNHHLDDQWQVYENLDCEHLIIDTWTDKAPINRITEALSIHFVLESKWIYKPNRIVMRYRKK